MIVQCELCRNQMHLEHYLGEHEMPGWAEVAWKARGGYGSQSDGRGRANAKRETIWFSKHCLKVGLFE